MRSQAIASTLAIAVVGCGPQLHTTVLTDMRPAPRAVDAPIQVFLTQRPKCPFTELATLKAAPGAFAGGPETYLPAMRKRARELGGDALIGYDQRSTVQGYVEVAPGVVAAAKGEEHRAVVIRFTDPACTS